MNLFRSSRRSPPRSEDELIRDFWVWWSAGGAVDVITAFDSGNQRRIVRLLGKRVRSLHPEGLSWQLQPGIAAKLMLVVTAEGVPSKAGTARHWLDEAPAPDEHWEYSDERRPWTTSVIEWAGVEFDPDDTRIRWSEASTTGPLDVVIYHPGFASVDQAARDAVMFLLLDLQLGERIVESQVGELSNSVLPLPNGRTLSQLDRVIRDRSL